VRECPHWSREVKVSGSGMLGYSCSDVLYGRHRLTTLMDTLSGARSGSRRQSSLILNAAGVTKISTRFSPRHQRYTEDIGQHLAQKAGPSRGTSEDQGAGMRLSGLHHYMKGVVRIAKAEIKATQNDVATGGQAAAKFRRTRLVIHGWNVHHEDTARW